jgi:hypothetical protein
MTISRRGLFGLMAVAPIAAVKAMQIAPETPRPIFRREDIGTIVRYWNGEPIRFYKMRPRNIEWFRVPNLDSANTGQPA